MITESNLSIEAQMAALRAEYGLSKKELANRLGRNLQSLRRWKKTGIYPREVAVALKGIEMELISTRG